ncbi:hypothetical protein LRS13_08985 [Svornostia abyssi]|uniref:Uncharacterized protein n=1 Tax=Svornostia abyssi TaxID=2898438 RepID=A0ABY5PM69_9ACTN|nr:hypothetical protein LRS13_08985 [Parviterribacteraceae bacterium J379]
MSSPGDETLGRGEALGADAERVEQRLRVGLNRLAERLHVDGAEDTDHHDPEQPERDAPHDRGPHAPAVLVADELDHATWFSVRP